jgi:hypothetical protein
MLGRLCMYLWLGVAVYTAARIDSDNLCQGEWVTDSTTPIERVPASRVSLVDTPAKIWLQDACPTQTVQHSCYAHGNTDRARRLEQRMWKPFDEQECRPFQAADFLRLLGANKLLISGDSIAMQLWTAITCSTYQTAQSNVSVDWFLHTPRTIPIYNEKICPFGAAHCHIHGGSVRFASGGQISFNLMINYQPGLLKTLIYLFGLQPSDYIVINWGVHTNPEERALLVQSYADFNHDLVLLGRNVPQVLYLETFPQHFGGEVGTYNGSTPSQDGLQCYESSLTGKEFHDKDWRSREADKITKSVPVVRVADALSSQWDAHVQSSMLFPYTAVDCTHWCFPSGVFSFVLRKIYNSMYYYSQLRSDK